MSQPMCFGEYLKTIRLSQHTTLTAAARKMGMTPQKLSDIESGRRYNTRISISLVTKVAKAYGIPVSEIIRNTETAVHNDRTVSELLTEVIPIARMAELLSKQILNVSKTYSDELESLAQEVYDRNKDLRSLLSTMRKRHFNTDKDSIMDPENDESPIIP
jgi:transcriptional regulator with XRE-family HTH domain